MFKSLIIGAVVVRLAFSPSLETQEQIVKEISKASETLYVAIYSLTNKVIANAILDAKKRGVVTQVVCDEQQSSIKNSLCKQVGARIDGEHGLMHNKFVVVDNTIVCTGSYNFTDNATKNNRENSLCIEGQSDIAAAYLEEFYRIWQKSKAFDRSA